MTPALEKLTMRRGIRPAGIGHAGQGLRGKEQKGLWDPEENQASFPEVVLGRASTVK